MRFVPVPVAETSWLLDVNGTRIAEGTASPGRERELATGLLVTDGFIDRSDGLLELDIRQGPLAVTLHARVEEAVFDAAMAASRHRSEHGCGMLHWIACDPAGLHRPRTDRIPENVVLAARLRALFEACNRAQPAGGIHAAAVVDGDDVDYTAIDVSRHAATAKAAGAAILAGIDRSGHGLVLTARVSGRIALTAARAGLGWIASRSIPTTLAVAIAARAGLPIIARAASTEPHTFMPPRDPDIA